MVDPSVPSSPKLLFPASILGRAFSNAFANTSSKFLPLLPGATGGATTAAAGGVRLNNCGLCRAKLAFVGDAKDGLRLRGVVAPSLRTGIRLGVVGASMGTDVVGEVLRRFDGEDSIYET